MRRSTLAAPFVALSLFAAACSGGADPVVAPPDDDAGVTDPDLGEVGFPSDDTLLHEARGLLGMSEDDLSTEVDVRIRRRGDETFALTEDYVLGRRTVELDDDGDGSGFRVRSVTIELADGPETVVLEPN